MDAEDYLLKIPLWTKKKNSLTAVRRFLEAMGNPDSQMRIIHVAGTNGKGSVCAYLTAELMRLGGHVGTFVSPHLVSVRERLLYDGQPIDKKMFQETFESLQPLVERMRETGYQHPSFFEYLFLMAMQYYRQQPVDFLIMETGLGGLLDTTNVINSPALTIITSIGLDHTQYLGTTIREIAVHKAGIIKPGCPLVYDNSRPEASAVLAERAAEAGSRCYPVRLPDEEAVNWFAAPYQAQNAAVAAQALQVLLGFSNTERQTAVRRMSAVVWPGRMEAAAQDIWLDGAHNEDGIQAFALAAKRISRQRGKRIQLLFAAAADKHYSGMIAILCRELSLRTVTIAHFANDRAAGHDKLAAEFRRRLNEVPVKAFSDSRAALAYALKQKTADDLLFVAGSLYLIGEIKAIMEEL